MKYFAPYLIFLALGMPLFASADMETWAHAIGEGPHRLSGTPESAKAISVIESGLRNAGIERVMEQRFPVMECVIEACFIEGEEGHRTELLPLRENSILAPVTGVDGLEGILYKGIPKEKTWEPGRAIVVLGSDDHSDWRKAFALGASAVIFTADTAFSPLDIPHVNAPINLPRYFFEGSADELPMGESVHLVSRMKWKESEGRNLFMLVEGQEHPSEVVVISAQIDTLGVVPLRSPGGWNAWNASALMELAVRFSRQPPACSILFAFLDGESRGLSGSTAFYDLVAGEDSFSRFSERQASVEREQSFLNRMVSAIVSDYLEEMDAGLRRTLIRRMKLIAFERQSSVEKALATLRYGTASSMADGMSESELEDKRAGWTAFLRGLDLGDLGALDPRLKEDVKEQLQGDLNSRLAELDRTARQLSSQESLVSALVDHEIVLHTSLALGDTTPRWGILFGGRSGWRSAFDRPGLYGRVQRAFFNGYNNLPDLEKPQSFVSETVNGYLPAGSRLWGPQYLVHSGEVAGQYGIFNCVAGTIGLSLPHLGTRSDRVEAYDPSLIREQVEQFGSLLESMTSGDSLGLRRMIWPDVQTIESGFDKGLRSMGPQVWERNLGRMVSVRPLSGVIIQVTPQPLNEEGDSELSSATSKLLNVAWYDDQRLTQSNANGTYRVAGISLDKEKSYSLGGLFSEDGSLRMISTLESASEVQVRMNMVEVRSGWLVAEPAMREGDIKLMAGRSNSMLEGRRSFYGSYDNWIFWHAEPEAHPVKVFGKGLAARLDQQPEEAASSPSRFSVMDSALDLWNLNEARLDMLEDGGIIQGSLKAIHGESAGWLESAKSQTNGESAAARYAMGFWTEGPVYERIMSALNDIVIAVLFLLLLTIPFAVALERLVIGAVSIQGRIAGFAGFFLAAFLGFYLTHPAFDLSPAPLIIFLGFGILLLSVAVITVLVRRFESEILKLQGMAGSVHGDQVSRIGTMAVAMQMGVSTMRRRPMRTAMSILTVGLLTFAILIFASFTSKLGVVEQYVRPVPAYAGVLMMKPDRSELPRGLADKVRSLWPDYAVSGRWWLVQEELGGETWSLLNRDGSRHVLLRGILGLEQSELVERADLQGLFGEPDESFAESVWLSDVLAVRIGVGQGDAVLVNGIPLTVRLVLNRAELAGLADMTGEGILPVDFTTIEEEPQNSSQNTTTEPPRPKDILSPDSVVIVSADAARRMGASLRALSIYLHDLVEAEMVAGQLAKALEVPIAATRKEGVYWHTLGIVVEASGLSQLIVPMLLGALIIFGTLLGSVVDREREIYTFSALGLAPGHVASLFLAESLIYAIVGGVAGFLGTQTFITVLDWTASLRGWIVPEINYSSMNSIFALLTLMGTVLISAVYPAIRASRSANPGLMRNWKMPEPDGDLLDIIFPFTVSTMDFESVLGFLFEHFQNYKDSSLGSFLTWETYLKTGTGGGALLESRMALTPYDLGVTQTFQMESRQGEIEGIEEIQIRLRRLSGQPGNWKRLNKRLLQDLRRQMLLWRTLTPRRMEHYRSLAIQRLADQLNPSTPEAE